MIDDQYKMLDSLLQFATSTKVFESNRTNERPFFLLYPLIACRRVSYLCVITTNDIKYSKLYVAMFSFTANFVNLEESSSLFVERKQIIELGISFSFLMTQFTSLKETA